jgi:hypothetical protein
MSSEIWRSDGGEYEKEDKRCIWGGNIYVEGKSKVVPVLS